MTKKGTKINNTKLKSKLEKYYNQSINELRQYTNGSTGAFFKNGTFRFVSNKNIKKNLFYGGVVTANAKNAKNKKKSPYKKDNKLKNQYGGYQDEFKIREQ